MKNSALEQKTTTEVMEEVNRKTNESLMNVHRALADFQKNFDTNVVVPFSRAQINTELEEALQNQAKSRSKVRILEQCRRRRTIYSSNKKCNITTMSKSTSWQRCRKRWMH
ncbi:hypothetical protein WMY93_010868 [Mugilogobius chulae]|uniref:Uncharacterized protein n=1 Tax=Mugilogobius chulae TaxID=88201 RepID=A0AAW0PIZ2_9GOBI